MPSPALHLDWHCPGCCRTTRDHSPLGALVLNPHHMCGMLPEVVERDVRQKVGAGDAKRKHDCCAVLQFRNDFRPTFDGVERLCVLSIASSSSALNIVQNTALTGHTTSTDIYLAVLSNLVSFTRVVRIHTARALFTPSLCLQNQVAQFQRSVRPS